MNGAVDLWRNDNVSLHGHVSERQLRLWGPDDLFLTGIVGADRHIQLFDGTTPFAEGRVDGDGAISLQDLFGRQYEGRIILQ